MSKHTRPTRPTRQLRFPRRRGGTMIEGVLGVGFVGMAAVAAALFKGLLPREESTPTVAYADDSSEQTRQVLSDTRRPKAWTRDGRDTTMPVASSASSTASRVASASSTASRVASASSDLQVAAAHQEAQAGTVRRPPLWTDTNDLKTRLENLGRRRREIAPTERPGSPASDPGRSPRPGSAIWTTAPHIEEVLGAGKDVPDRHLPSMSSPAGQDYAALFREVSAQAAARERKETAEWDAVLNMIVRHLNMIKNLNAAARDDAAQRKVTAESDWDVLDFAQQIRAVDPAQPEPHARRDAAG